MARPDPYRVLGVLPSADESVIRAAYLALMKRYHPDHNRSDEAAGRAQDVAAAFALLSDPERRAEFDRQRLIVEPRPVPRVGPAQRPVRGRAGGILLVALSAGLVGFAVTRPMLPVPGHHPPAPPEVVAAPVVAATPVQSSPPPSERLPAVPAQLPTQPALPVVALPLPPAPPTVDQAAPSSAPEQTPAVRPRAPSRPATNPCETEASCPAIDLAALDQHLALLTTQSLQYADPETRALLVGTQTAFRSRMARCTSASCKRDAILARNREIAIIMRG